MFCFGKPFSQPIVACVFSLAAVGCVPYTGVRKMDGDPFLSNEMVGNTELNKT
jgi:hypothetical protein